jgi:predicted RNA-binding protein with PUA-like domain
LLPMKYWLLKTEPSVFSLSDLRRSGSVIWDGVRNYQARNYLRTATVGDAAFVYHSNAEPTGVVGLARVTETLVDDPTQFAPESPYFDPRSTLGEARWQTVRLEFIEEFPAAVTLMTLKEQFTPDELMVVRKGMRLSVMPVNDEVAQRILRIGRRQS